MEWYVWLVFVAVGIATLIIVDTKIIMPHALAYTFKKNTEWKRLMKDIQEIKEHLDLGDE